MGKTKAVTPGKPDKKSDPRLTRATRIQLYAARSHLGLDVLKETGLRMPVQVYFKDPRVAERFKDVGIDPDFTTPWEPGLRDGPTSARFAVVDYDSTTNTLTPPAVWNQDENCYFAPDGTPLDGNAIALFQFHQLSVWAIVQNTLSFFESGFALGRRISWAFEGNRLIIVPHAGYGQNAYYDRESKSLQLYWFDDGLYVTQAALQAAGALGTKLAQIGGMPIDQAYAAVATVISHDTEIWAKALSPDLLVVP